MSVSRGWCKYIGGSARGMWADDVDPPGATHGVVIAWEIGDEKGGEKGVQYRSSCFLNGSFSRPQGVGRRKRGNPETYACAEALYFRAQA